MYSAAHIEKLRRHLRQHGWTPAWCPLVEYIPRQGGTLANDGFSVIDLDTGSLHTLRPSAHLAPVARLCLRLARSGERVALAGPFGCLSPPSI